MPGMQSEVVPPCAPWQARALERLRARALRTIKRLVRPGLLRALDAANRESSRPVVEPGGPVVSLTTHGIRLGQVHYTLESIAQGELRPSRLVLWLDQGLVERGLPDTLHRLMARGLEVHGTVDVGPHTKYFPQVMSEPSPALPLVTADDDILYPPYWLQALQAHATRHPGTIACFRAHQVGLLPGQRLAPYAEWRRCQSTEPSHLHFLTGVSGVLYPVAMQQALREAGNGFLQACPKGDDIWLNLVALRSGHRVAQVKALGRRFFDLPGTKEEGLARSNVRGGGNDRQLAATYSAEDLAKLAENVQGAPTTETDTLAPAAGSPAGPAASGLS
jgi:hypothetical protein